MSELTTGQQVTASQPGTGLEVTGTYAGPAQIAGFGLVQHVTGAGRTVVGTFPLSRIAQAA